MLTKIERISDVAVFRDFRWGSLKDFGTHNLIFGANGSGKTTISEALRSIGDRSSVLGKLRLAFSDGSKLELSDGAESPHPFSIFNAAYVTDNLLYQQGATAQTLYYIGAESAIARQELDAAEEKLADARGSFARASSNARGSTNELNRFGTDSARLIRTTLTALGDTRYARYERPDYFQAAATLETKGTAEVERVAQADKDALATRASAPEMSKQPLVYDPFSDAQKLKADAEGALSANLDLHGVLDLVVRPELTEWLQQGATLHDEIDYADCLFCGRPDFPPARRQLLERAFSRAYNEFQRSIERRINALVEHAGHCRDISIPDDGLMFEDLRAGYRASTVALALALDDLQSWLTDAKEALEEHRRDPSRSPRALPALPSNGQSALEAANLIIVTHNGRCENIEADRRAAGKLLEDSLVADTIPEFQRLSARQSAAKGGVERASMAQSEAEKEVLAWRGQLRDSIGAARGLESDIHHYLGHDELEIQVNADESAFIITREGRPAVGLSEGEKTAIALLYFLRSLDHDDGTRRQDRIVVLDDPVSSLDGNSLLAASEHIRERTRGVRQLLLFTHNDQLFLDSLRWMRADVSNVSQSANAYMLNVSYTAQGRSSKIVPIDPMLEKYRSMYMFAFAEMYRYHRSVEGEFAGDLYRLPNLARRFLEQFCLHRYPSLRAGLGVAKDEFAKEGFDAVASNRLVNLLHIDSHGVEERDRGLGLARFQEVRNVVGDVLRLVELADVDHYRALEELLLKHEPDLRAS
ncbi:MAG: AAA family ATPase [Chloroflexi bacterium]|nr:AAA family ATPase [Chloroflexota bacterium]